MPLLRQSPYVRFGPVRRKHSQFLTIPFGVISYAALAMPIGEFVGFRYPSLNR